MTFLLTFLNFCTQLLNFVKLTFLNLGLDSRRFIKLSPHLFFVSFTLCNLYFMNCSKTSPKIGKLYWLGVLFLIVNFHLFLCVNSLFLSLFSLFWLKWNRYFAFCHEFLVSCVGYSSTFYFKYLSLLYSLQTFSALLSYFSFFFLLNIQSFRVCKFFGLLNNWKIFF